MLAPASSLSQTFEDRVSLHDAILETPVIPADLAIVLGNRHGGACTLLARRASELHHAGLAPRIVASGGVINNDGLLEAEHIHRVLISEGVPESAVLIERLSTNTKENILFARELAERVWDLPETPRVIAVGQRYASRRAVMTLRGQWPRALPMTAPICTMGTPVENWLSDTFARTRIAREAEKIRTYLAKGDLAPVNDGELLREIRRHARRLSGPA